MSGPFWLSHHGADELDRCWRLGGVHVCARCLGTYPVLALTMALQGAFRAPLAHPADVPLAVGLLAPALGDWAFGRFFPHRLSNAWRTFTGVLLGIALGRSLFVHVQRPLPAMLVWQAALVAAVATPVILVVYLRRPRG